MQIKVELEFQIYFRKITLHQQKFLVVLVLSNSPWLLRSLKNVQNSFQLATLLAYFSIATVQATSHRIFLCLLRDDMN